MKINFSRYSRIFPSWHLLCTENHRVFIHVLVQCTYFAVRRWEGIGMINSTYRHRTKGKKVQTSELKKCWMVLEADALYSEGTKMTCCSFLAVSDQSYNCISYFFLFFRLSYFVLYRPGDLLISSLSPAIPIITFYLQLLKKKYTTEQDLLFI